MNHQSQTHSLNHSGGYGAELREYAACLRAFLDSPGGAIANAMLAIVSTGNATSGIFPAYRHAFLRKATQSTIFLSGRLGNRRRKAAKSGGVKGHYLSTQRECQIRHLTLMVIVHDIIPGKALATTKCTYNLSRNAKAQSMTAFFMLLMLCICISGCGGGSVKDGIENTYGSATSANQDDGTGDNDGDDSGNVGDDIRMSAFKWLKPEATTNGINSMIFSGDTLYAAGDFGTIVRADAPGDELVVQTMDMTGLVQSPSSFHFQGI